MAVTSISLRTARHPGWRPARDGAPHRHLPVVLQVLASQTVACPRRPSYAPGHRGRERPRGPLYRIGHSLQFPHTSESSLRETSEDIDGVNSIGLFTASAPDLRLTSPPQFSIKTMRSHGSPPESTVLS